jgi:hypothetical protein
MLPSHFPTSLSVSIFSFEKFNLQILHRLYAFHNYARRKKTRSFPGLTKFPVTSIDRRDFA